MRVHVRQTLLLALLLTTAIAMGGASLRGPTTVRGEAQTSGFAPITQAISPNGTRLQMTGGPQASFDAVAPNGTRVALDLFAGQTPVIGETLVVF